MLRSSDSAEVITATYSLVSIAPKNVDSILACKLEKYIVNHSLTADTEALQYMPCLGESYSGWLPVIVEDDGNCLPRSASVACFGTETAHEEIRTRIGIEMALHKEQYINNDYINRGIDLPRKEAANLLKTYTMFSYQYHAGDRITTEVSSRIFEAEALSVVQSNTFMGIWQLFALSSSINANVQSIYLQLGDHLPQITLHRKIIPRGDQNVLDSCVIMWSSTRHDMLNRNWIPNHFVPIIPSTTIPNIDFFEDEEEFVLDNMLDDSVMMTLLQTVTE